MSRAAITGTIVADASSLGLHWIYSQGKIAKIVRDHDGVAEFLEPDESNYKGVPAFFAHPHRSAGDSSNYGEYIYVLLRAISSAGFDRGAYIRTFQDYFGVGGEYVGYADGPMRETIFRIAQIGKEIEQTVLESDADLSEERLTSAAHYISRYYFEYDPEGLKEQIRNPLKLQQWSKEELAEADRLVDAVSSAVGAVGPDDDQMPALSRSAVLAHFYSGEELDRVVREAVAITNNNEKAIAYSRFFAQVMRDLYEARPDSPAAGREVFAQAVDEHRTKLPSDSAKLVEKASALEELDYKGAAKQFGAACHVDMAVPVALHIVLRTESFREANRANILASGDNCGRAIMLGAAAGAIYGTGGEVGIPTDWIDRSTMMEKAAKTPGGRLLLD